MENAKSKLVFTGTVNMTEKKDNRGNTTGLVGSCILPLVLADRQQHNCIVIPIDMNPALFVSQKTGAVTLDVNVYENAVPNRSGNTHFIRASVGSKGKQMSDDARRQASPIIGNLKPFDATQKSQQGPQNLGGAYNPYGGPAPQQPVYPQAQPQGMYPQQQPAYPPQGAYPPAPQQPQQPAYPPQGAYPPAPQQPQQPTYPPQGAYPPAPGYAPQADGDMPDFTKQ